VNYEGPAKDEFAALVDELALPAEPQGSLYLDGDPPRLASPHRISLAAALALLAEGAAIAALWEQRGGHPQEIRLNARDAVFELNPLPWLRRNAHVAMTLAHVGQPCAGYFRTRDQRMFLIVAYSPRLLEGTLRLLGCPNDHEAVSRLIADRDGEELERAFAGAGLTGALVRSSQEWLHHPEGRLLTHAPVLQIERIGDAPPMRLSPATRPFGGIRVGDMTHVIAGPIVSRCLAEQGADVLHLGPIHPKLVDPTGLTIATGMGKRSAIIDFSAGDGPLLSRLLRGADVFVESWRPGMLEAHGFGPAQVAAVQPGIIYLSVSCYGSAGSWARRGGFDPLAQASTGMAEDEARCDTYKLSPPGVLTDAIAGFLGAAAIASVLARRAREGGSWHIKISLARIAMWIQSLGQYPDGGTPDDMGSPRIWQMESPFGILDYVAPALRYSETPSHFDTPPVPVGASPLSWLPASA
jgi:crotonobetainyl-CoA:carnitine CoA-transferase CaiB-like acyl-CoA transferase